MRGLRELEKKGGRGGGSMLLTYPLERGEKNKTPS